MKTDFKKFRRLRKAAHILMVLGIVAIVCNMIFLPVFSVRCLHVALNILVAIFLGFPAVICECAAYDNLICPYCGQRAVKAHRECPSDKANVERLKAIIKGKPFECMHCKRMIETA